MATTRKPVPPSTALLVDLERELRAASTFTRDLADRLRTWQDNGGPPRPRAMALTAQGLRTSSIDVALDHSIDRLDAIRADLARAANEVEDRRNPPAPRRTNHRNGNGAA